LAAAARSSQPAVSRVERGQLRGLSVGTLTSVAEALGAHVDLRLTWNGERLDRLLDAEHAATVEWIVGLLQDAGWDTLTEATFQRYGERGSIDVLARHAGTGLLLVVEVKTVVPDLQALLASHDRKVRLAPGIAQERGWPAGPVARLLVLVDGRTTRRRLSEHRLIFTGAYPVRSRAAAAWLCHPTLPPIAGLLFSPDIRHSAARQRVRRDTRAG
jgi:hypothetical protein